jgi:hypothetical protein
MTIFFYVHKRIITGQPRPNIVVDVPRVVVQVHRAGAVINAIIPVAA